MSLRNWLLLAFLVVAAFAGLLVYGDLREIRGLLAESPSPYGGLAAALGLAALNYALRYVRWAMCLRALDIRVPGSISLAVFLAGLALSITPGKVGELLKSVWLNRRAGVPVSASAPAVVMERLTDVVSVALLGLAGVSLLPTPVALVVGGVLAVAMFAGLLLASRYGLMLLRVPPFNRWREPLEQSQDGVRRLMSPGILAAAVALGGLAWAAEGLALWIVVVSLGQWIGPLVALPISAAAALVGAVTALPGGLVGFEGSMVALLRQSGIPAAEAALATLITRVATLWFAVLIGLLAWVWMTRGRFMASRAEAPGEAAT